MTAILWLVNTVISLFIWILVISAVLSWLDRFRVVNTQNRFVYAVMDFCCRVTEPALRPLRRFLPNLAGIDISPVVLILVLMFLRNFLLDDLVPMLR